MSTHTKGPWEYDGKFQVCIPHEKGLACFRTSPEDARLIAAAPELLETVKALLIDVYEKYNLGDAQSETEIKARAVIAKAEGE